MSRMLLERAPDAEGADPPAAGAGSARPGPGDRRRRAVIVALSPITAMGQIDRYKALADLPFNADYKLPLNAQIQAFSNVERPDFGPEWTLRFQLQFLFPKG